MKIIKAGRPVVNLAGLPMAGQDNKILTVGVAIANILQGTADKAFDVFKSQIMSKKFVESKDVEIDEADLEILKEIVKKNGRAVYLDIVLSNILDALSCVDIPIQEEPKIEKKSGLKKPNL